MKQDIDVPTMIYQLRRRAWLQSNSWQIWIACSLILVLILGMYIGYGLAHPYVEHIHPFQSYKFLKK